MTLMFTEQEIINWLKLEPHPEEGGFYRETYRSEEWVPKGALPDRYPAPRSFGTAIYYLLTPVTCSRLHRVSSDEIFHFYLGDPVRMLWLGPQGRSESLTLGQDLRAGQRLQVTVPRGVWQGCHLVDGGQFALMGCTVAPGFEFADYQAGDRESLLSQYPDQEDLIRRLTP